MYCLLLNKCMTSEFIQYLKEQLAPLGKIHHKRMFGEICLFNNGRMFAIIDKQEQVFVKTSQRQSDEIAFCYQRQGKIIALNYVLIDNGLIDDADELVQVVRQLLYR